MQPHDLALERNQLTDGAVDKGTDPGEWTLVYQSDFDSQREDWPSSGHVDGATFVDNADRDGYVLQIPIDLSSSWFWIGGPIFNTIRAIRASFWLNTDKLTLPTNAIFDAFHIHGDGSEENIALLFRARLVTSQLTWFMRAIDDQGSNHNSNQIQLSGWNKIELEWNAASSVDAADGSASLTINGALIDTLTGIDTDDDQPIKWVEFGCGYHTGATGIVLLDDVELYYR